jgi:HEAT repeat protein
MRENDFPTDEKGAPDLSYYDEPAAYYTAMHAQAMREMRSGEGDSKQAFARRVHGCWGLIAKGEESVPIALQMVASGNRDAREDGAAILAEVGRSEAVVARLLDALQNETDAQARDSILQALGGLRNRMAIPALSVLIEDEATDGDTRWMAVEGLGKVVRRRFLEQPDPIAAALEWIAKARRRGTLA